jgi:hypothetical protein
MFSEFQIISHITGALHVSTDMLTSGASKIAVGNCCTSVDEYNSKVFPCDAVGL